MGFKPRFRVGRRGAALLFFAFLDMYYGVSLLAPTKEARSSSAMMWVASILPLWVWSLGWFLVAALCMVDAFRQHDRIAFSAAMGIKMLWAGIYVGAQLAGVLERGFAGAAIWLALAALVGLLSSWPEPPQEGPAWTPPSS